MKRKIEQPLIMVTNNTTTSSRVVLSRVLLEQALKDYILKLANDSSQDILIPLDWNRVNYQFDLGDGYEVESVTMTYDAYKE